MAKVRRGSPVLAAVVVAVALVAGPSALASAGARAAGPPTVARAGDFVTRIDEVRQSVHLPPLAIHVELTAVAQRWSEAMRGAGNIAHNPKLAEDVTANWFRLGENVGRGPSLDALMDALVHSPHHYANLVDPLFTQVGVGVAITDTGTIYVTQVFARMVPDDHAAPARPARVTSPATLWVTTSAQSTPVAPRPAQQPASLPPMPLRLALSLEQLQGLMVL